MLGLLYVAQYRCLHFEPQQMNGKELVNHNRQKAKLCTCVVMCACVHVCVCVCREQVVLVKTAAHWTCRLRYIRLESALQEVFIHAGIDSIHRDHLL